MSAQEIASFAEFARLAGFKPSYVTQLKREDRLVLTEDKKAVRVQESLRRIRETRDPSKKAVADRHAAARAAPESGMDEIEDIDALEPPGASAVVGGPAHRRAMALALKEEFLAKAAQRDYELSIGKLMAAADVESAIATAITILRNRIEPLSDLLPPQLAPISDEAQIRTMLAEVFEHTLSELSRQFAKIAQAGAA